MKEKKQKPNGRKTVQSKQLELIPIKMNETQLWQNVIRKLPHERIVELAETNQQLRMAIYKERLLTSALFDQIILKNNITLQASLQNEVTQEIEKNHLDSIVRTNRLNDFISMIHFMSDFNIPIRFFDCTLKKQNYCLIKRVHKRFFTVNHTDLVSFIAPTEKVNFCSENMIYKILNTKSSMTEFTIQIRGHRITFIETRVYICMRDILQKMIPKELFALVMNYLV
jgi:hypothetical protein